MTALAALAGAGIVGGLWLLLTGLRPVPPPTRSGRSMHLAAKDRDRLAVAAVAGLGALVLTRWPVAAVAVGVVGWVAAGAPRRRDRRAADQRTEAIALWTEMLRDAIGTARGVEGVLVATASTAPLAIRPDVQRMARRLQREPLEVVLDGLAEDLDHPIGDLVVTALQLTATTGGRQVREVLDSLATSAYAEAESRRRIDVARERPRAAMRYTAMVIAGFIVLLVVFSRGYLEPYDSAIGQVILVFVGFYWAAGFWWMSRMGQTPTPPRLLDTEATT